MKRHRRQKIPLQVLKQRPRNQAEAARSLAFFREMSGTTIQPDSTNDLTPFPKTSRRVSDGYGRS